MFSVIRDVILTYQLLFRVVGAALAMLLAWALKGPLAALITNLVIKIVSRSKIPLEPKEIRYILSPLRALLVVAGVFIVLPLFGFSIQANFVLRSGLRIAVIGICTWILARLWDCTAEVLFTMNSSLNQQLNINLSKTLLTFLRKAVKR